MAYKKKLIIMISLISILTLAYIASFLFSPEFTGSRSAFHTWIDTRLSSGISRIRISLPQDSMEFIKRGNLWFVSYNNNEYPARQLRIGDFISIFTTRAQWPVRYTHSDSHPRIGLDLESASRVSVYSDNTLLLDILLGAADTAGDVFVRRFGQNEVRSGSSLISTYARDSVSSWYNLRIIPETEGGSIDASHVQRLTVYVENQPPQIFSRRNRQWELSGLDVSNPDQNDIETYVRTILNIDGEDFADDISPSDPVFNHGRLVFELGTGNIITIRISDLDESGRRYANVNGSNYVYAVPAWASSWMIRTAADFEVR